MLVYLGLSAVAASTWFLWSFPDHPKSVSGWLWVLLLALPIQIVGEFAGESLWNGLGGRAIERRTSDRSFSWLRILYGLMVTLVFCGGVIGLTLLVRYLYAAASQGSHRK